MNSNHTSAQEGIAMNTAVQPVQIPTAGTYHVDPAKSEITFEAKHLFGLGTVRGSFELDSATLEIAAPVAQSSAKATVSAASHASGSTMRDKQVRGKRFLHAAAFPTITFVSTELRQVDGAWVLEGTLTVRGHSEPVSLAIVESTAANDSLTLVATTRIDRYAFGIKASRGMAGRHLDMTLRLVARAEHGSAVS
jgi:polyisoprenoid-binding protein YceI